MIFSLYFACFLTVDEEIGRINGILAFLGKGNLARAMVPLHLAPANRAFGHIHAKDPCQESSPR